MMSVTLIVLGIFLILSAIVLTWQVMMADKNPDDYDD